MLEQVHVCDSCKREERSAGDSPALGLYGGNGPQGWAHIDLRATVPHKDEATSALVRATSSLMEGEGVKAAFPKKARKAYKDYLSMLEAQGPQMTQRMDHYDLCPECAPKLLAFLVTMNLTARPQPMLPPLLGVGTVVDIGEPPE